MNILIFNWRDLKHPQGGGAELFLHEQAKIWIKNKNKVTWICGGFKGGEKREVIDGIEFIRVGNDLSLYLLAPFLALLPNTRRIYRVRQCRYVSHNCY